jgi:hypothetical protein
MADPTSRPSKRRADQAFEYDEDSATSDSDPASQPTNTEDTTTNHLPAQEHALQTTATTGCQPVTTQPMSPPQPPRPSATLTGHPYGNGIFSSAPFGSPGGGTFCSVDPLLAININLSNHTASMSTTMNNILQKIGEQATHITALEGKLDTVIVKLDGFGTEFGKLSATAAPALADASDTQQPPSSETCPPAGHEPPSFPETIIYDVPDPGGGSKSCTVAPYWNKCLVSDGVGIYGLLHHIHIPPIFENAHGSIVPRGCCYPQSASGTNRITDTIHIVLNATPTKLSADFYGLALGGFAAYTTGSGFRAMRMERR